MPATAKKLYQNTTVRMPRYIFEQAKTAVGRSQASSFNEFVVQAIEEKVRRMSESEIDSAFAQMADDPQYQQESNKLAREFERSDWEAFQSTTVHERAKARPAKTRSR
jgi:hypothetical protein